MMKKRSWLTGLFLLILSSITVIVRIYYVNHMMSEVNINEDIYNAAKVSIGSGGLSSVFADGFRMQSLYICNLYFAFLIFGNFTVAGVYLNMLYQLLTIVFVYMLIRNVANCYVGFLGSLILSILPIYVNTLSDVTIQNMLICMAALVGAVVISAVHWIVRRSAVKKDISAKTDMDSEARNEEIKSGADTSETANADLILDTSLKEIRYDDLEDNKVQYIENPLPVPRRREHKEMDYAFEPAGNDDYDMKDLTDKDFYDIE